jgi:hypothetical protein
MNTSIHIELSSSRQPGNARLNPWIFQILTDRMLNRKTVAVALYLRNIFDMTTGFTSPSFRTIAAATSTSRGSAERAVRLLAALGHLRVLPGGGGPANSNIYRLGGLS